jgi:hypothetical protein
MSSRAALPCLAALAFTFSLAGCPDDPRETAPIPSSKTTARVEDTAHPVARADEPHPAGEAPRIDIAFCIDTTGSMQDVIDSAKEKIEEIAAYIERGTPKPTVRFAVVEYRDKGEAFITKRYGLSPDVKGTRELLAGIVANGGGDAPEHVVAGLRAAVEHLGWDEQAALRLVFLVGDAPPHLDGETEYAGEGNVDPILEAAKKSGIVICSVICGDNMGAAGTAFWKKVAGATGGVCETIASAESISLESILLEAVRVQAGKKGIAY